MPNDYSQELYTAVSEPLSRMGDTYVTEIRRQLLERGNLASGKLYNSVVFQVSLISGKVTLEIQTEDYFKWVDQGRAAGKYPPIEDIIKWIEVRGIRPRGIPDTKHGLPKTTNSLAFLIARSIGLKGIKPANIMSGLKAQYEDQLVIEVNNTLSEKVSEIFFRELHESAANNNITIRDN